MEPGATRRTNRFSSYERLVAIGLALLAVLSPLYIDRTTEDDSELDLQEPINFAAWLPLLLVVLILAITLSLYLDRSFTSVKLQSGTGRLSSTLFAVLVCLLCYLATVFTGQTPCIFL
ncbi:uncharacterized protein LOC126784242 [Argentina anserina]|uniref:uncharacterized protein LOC126784242 n=1 Tax=Argentina anserina TaxID=57926 RepID=UPI00217690A4|nr:uncharacterized protein LOC126784242 [Potentilla anserina]